MSTKQWAEDIFEMGTKIDDCEQDYILTKILRPLILSLKFTGFNFSDNDNKYIYFLRRICFTILLCFVIVIAVSKFIWLLKCGLYFNAELVENIVSTIWTFQAMISLIFLIYWQMCKRIPNICQLMMNANGQEGIRKSRKRLFLKQSIFLFNHVLFFIICTVATIDSLFEGVRFNVSHSIWSGLIFGCTQLNFVVLICMIFMLFSWSLSIAFVSFLCDCMAIEFSYVNEKMKSEENLDVEKLDGYYNLYQRLSKVVEYADEAFRIYIFFMLCCDIPIIILLVYSLFNLRLIPPLQIFVLFVWLLFTFSHLLSMAIFPSSVNDNVRINSIHFSITQFFETRPFANTLNSQTDKRTQRLAFSV